MKQHEITKHDKIELGKLNQLLAFKTYLVKLLFSFWIPLIIVMKHFVAFLGGQLGFGNVLRNSFKNFILLKLLKKIQNAQPMCFMHLQNLIRKKI